MEHKNWRDNPELLWQSQLDFCLKCQTNGLHEMFDHWHLYWEAFDILFFNPVCTCIALSCLSVEF